MWKRYGIFLRIEFGILSSSGALLLLRFLRHWSYVSFLKYVCRGVFGSLFFNDKSIQVMPWILFSVVGARWGVFGLVIARSDGGFIDL